MFHIHMTQGRGKASTPYPNAEKPIEYIDAKDAAARAAGLNQIAKVEGLTIRYRVVPAGPAVQPTYDWRRRESARFDDGTYKPVPWAGEAWYLNSPYAKLHFVHHAVNESGKVAYTRDEEDGAADRQLRMRVGRYLERYFGGEASKRVLSSEEIATWSAKFGDPLGVKFATTADDIEHVYTNGPESCMSHGKSHFDSPYHPVRVYSGPDLAVAYIERDGAITARALAWPDKKRYATVYGDEVRLGRALEELGYKAQDYLHGARFRRSLHRGKFIVPYVDGCNTVHDNGEFLVMDENRGDISAQNTNGLAEAMTTCDRCEESVAEDNTNSVGQQAWCAICVDNYSFHCDDCEERHADDDRALTAKNGNSVCESCAGAYVECGECHEYVKSESGVAGHNIEDEAVCNTCAENMTTTDGCGRLVPNRGLACSCRDCTAALKTGESDDKPRRKRSLREKKLDATGAELEAEGQLRLPLDELIRVVERPETHYQHAWSVLVPVALVKSNQRLREMVYGFNNTIEGLDYRVWWWSDQHAAEHAARDMREAAAPRPDGTNDPGYFYDNGITVTKVDGVWRATVPPAVMERPGVSRIVNGWVNQAAPDGGRYMNTGARYSSLARARDIALQIADVAEGITTT